MLLVDLINALNREVKFMEGKLVASDVSGYKCDLTFKEFQAQIKSTLDPILKEHGLQYDRWRIKPLFQEGKPLDKTALPITYEVLVLHKNAMVYKVSFSKFKILGLWFDIPSNEDKPSDNATVSEYLRSLLSGVYIAQLKTLNESIKQAEANLDSLRDQRNDVAVLLNSLRPPTPSQVNTCPSHTCGSLEGLI